MAGFDNDTVFGLGLRLTQDAATNVAYQPVFRRFQDMFDLTDHVYICTWPGSPEGNIAADIGSLGLDSSNGAIYIKTTDTVNTGWVLTGPATGTISSVGVDAFTAPGTSPVLPTAGGLVTFTGAQVAAGTVPTAIRTDSLAANTVRIEVQRSSAQAVSSVAQNGVCHFNSAQFTVDANGFVSTIAGTAPWLDVGVPTAAANHTGYFVTAAVALTLPAGAANGDMVEVVDSIGGGVVVTASGANLIRIGNVVSSAGGTCTSTQLGDSARFVFRLANQTWYAVPGVEGNWVLA